MNSDVYWAAEDAATVIEELQAKRNDRQNFTSQAGLRKQWKTSYDTYYGRHFKNASSSDTTSVQRGGKEGELVLLRSNQYRNTLQHIHVMTCAQRPSFEVRAINSDYKSLTQAKLAGNILEYYLREKRMGRYLKTAAEHALVFGTGFVHMSWNPASGKPVGEDGGRMVYEGDVSLSCPTVYDVTFDQTKEDWNENEWYEVQFYRNKFNLAARYKDLHDEILSLETKNEVDSLVWKSDADETQDVPIFEFYHKRTDALPDGRYILYCSSDVVLYDGPHPYEKLGLFRIVPGDFFGSCYGYSIGFDLLPLQEFYNALISTAASNQTAYGLHNILVPEGGNYGLASLGEGLTAIKYNPAAGKPEPLNLLATNPEIFTMANLVKQQIEELSAVNSVVKGNPDSSLKSGVALGLVQSMAVAFMSGFQASWSELLEDTGTFLLDLLKQYANAPRLINISGKWNKGAMKEFTGDDLTGVSRAVVDMGNPMTRTTAGRMALADTLIQHGLVNGQEYLTVANTGSLEPLTQGKEAQLGLIHQENEALMEGRMVIVLASDAHLMHIEEHKALLDNPDVRMNADPASNQAIIDHIEAHMTARIGQKPIWAMINKEPPANPMEQQMPPPPGQAMPPQGPVMPEQPIGQPPVIQAGQPLPQIK